MLNGLMADVVKLLKQECDEMLKAETDQDARIALDGIVELVQLLLRCETKNFFTSAFGHDKMIDKDFINQDASQRLAFGLCKKYGIDLPKGATPADAWAALKEHTGKEAADFYAESGNKGADKIKFNTASQKTFVKNLNAAKESRPQQDRWRVTGMDISELRKYHPNANLHVTDGGSTVAIDNGDIVAVCKNGGDFSGSVLLRFAVKNGGKKLDSYDGNHEFYVKNGFEPVTWCKWDDEFAPNDWDSASNKRENIIFYRYTGKQSPYKNAQDFYQAVPPSRDYDAAYAERDRQL